MNHLGDTNKMVADTPRTDSRRGFHGWYTAVDAEFSEKLERELNAANDRIKRLEEALETLTCVIGSTPIKGNLAALQEAFDMARAVLKAKEAKP